MSWTIDWVNAQRTYTGKKGAEVKPMSPLAATVAEILSDVFGGIYNAPISVQRVDWAEPRFIEVCIRRELATFDSDHLTRLVVLCHDHAIRLSIEGAAPNVLRCQFHQRRPKREGEDVSCWEWHPTLEQAAVRVRPRVKPETASSPSPARAPEGRG